MHQLTWMERISIWLSTKLPKSLITDTERVGLSLAFIATGVVSLLALDDDNKRSSSIVRLLPEWVLIEWSITLALGGFLTIWGIQKSNRKTERVGMMLAAIGSATYGLSALILGTGRAKIIGVLFIILCLIKLIRLIVSTASAAYPFAVEEDE